MVVKLLGSKLLRIYHINCAAARGINRTKSVLVLIILVTLLSVPLSYTILHRCSDAEELVRFYTHVMNVCMKKEIPMFKTSNALPFCPCFPPSMGNGETDEGYLHSMQQYPTFNNIQLGGQWRPDVCTAREKVAIVIPYRDRAEHLELFLEYMHSFLPRQQRDYRIFVIEQHLPDIFNRATLLNIGFIEAEKLDNFDCYVFHDVDLHPIDLRNLYSCQHSPLHLGAYMSKFGYKITYDRFLGGAIALSKSQVIEINGFSNRFFGWGGEDDETYFRLKTYNISISRYPQLIGKSNMIKHQRDTGNPVNPVRLKLRSSMPKSEYHKDGFKQTNYRVEKYQEKPLYTWILVSIKPPPDNSACDEGCFDTKSLIEGLIDCCHNVDHVCCLKPRKHVPGEEKSKVEIKIVGS